MKWLEVCDILSLLYIRLKINKNKSNVDQPTEILIFFGFSKKFGIAKIFLRSPNRS